MHPKLNIEHMSLTETPKDQEVSPQKNGQTQNSVASSLRELIMGFRNTQLISVAAKLNLAEHLKKRTENRRKTFGDNSHKSSGTSPIAESIDEPWDF